MDAILTAILDDDRPRVKELLKAEPRLATCLIDEARLYQSKIFHWIYVGDTALHLAAAGYRVELIRLLLDAGADPNSTANHRQSGPLHYAADGYINGPDWDAKRQVKAIQCLLDAGAEINAQDKNGAAPLHRAVRTRCAAAVKCLLEAGSGATLKNKPGSTPFHLAVQDTGRGGSGAEAARAAQRQIIHEFLSFGLSPAVKDGKGKSVLDCARSSWIREMLSGLACVLVPALVAMSAMGFSPLCDPSDEGPCVLLPPAFMNFETAPVHPVDLSPDGRLLAVANLPAARVELFDASSGTLQRLHSVAVGVDPVSVRFRGTNELWVVNFTSGSISIVDVPSGRLRATVSTLAGPEDVVFAGTPARAFVSCARANTVQVLDPIGRLVITNLAVDGDRPKALAVAPDGHHVYAAVFESGNASTILAPGFTTLTNEAPPSVVDFAGGPYGGQNPPPNRGAGFFPAINTNIPPDNPPPKVSHIVKKNAAGRWLDDNAGDWTEFVSGTNASLSGRPVGWDMPDRDLAVIDTGTFDIRYASGVMNICMAVAANPVSGRVAVVGTDATNERRFEPNLSGTFVRVHLGLVDPAGLTSVSKDLNPHLDYQSRRLPQADRDRSLGDPRAIVWNSAGTRAYVAGMGSRNVVVLDADGNRARPEPIEVGDGPCGLALDETHHRLYVFNRFSSTLSVVDVDGQAVATNIALLDPTPAAIQLGRKHFYDTRANSGLGQASCASCHVDGRFDRLAWDLGNPAGELSYLPSEGGQVGPYHPMKGPMVTQTLQDILGGAGRILHWRGDRDGIESFNQTFTALLGRDELLTTGEMQELKAFISSLYFPPNPYRNFDNTLSSKVPLPGFSGIGTNGGIGAPLMQGDAVRGRTLSHDCRQCHPAFRGGGSSMFPIQLGRSGIMPFKPAQLRSVPEKLGMTTASTNSRAGFGFLHDGRVDSLPRLLIDGFPEFTRDRDMADLIAWVLSFTGSGEISLQDDDSAHVSLDVPAAVGSQLTLTSSGAVPLLAEMIAQADRADGSIYRLPAAGDLYALKPFGVDLVAHGTQGNLSRGWYYERRTGRFQSDRQTEDISLAELLALATSDRPLTLTLVLRGSGQRLGVDRDNDGYFDRTELEAGFDPEDARSHGEQVAARFYGTPEEWLNRLPEGIYSLHTGQTIAASLASEVFGHEFAYSLGGDVPPGATIDAVSGILTWTAAQPGVWRFFVRATENVWPHFNDVAAIQATAVSMRLRFERSELGDTLLLDGLPDGNYGLERKRRLSDTSWQSLGRLQLTTSGWSYVLTGDKEGFYRVIATP